MPRDYPTNLQNIYTSGLYEIDYYMTITFPNLAPYFVATKVYNDGKEDFSNDVESVKQLRQTLENATDQVGVELQNADGALGLSIATNYLEWQSAQVEIYRIYADASLNNYADSVAFFFGGAMQQPQESDTVVKFDVISDTIAKGGIVCSRTLSPPCPFKFGDAKTCGYTGAETACNHKLKSKAGCDGRGNTHHFGGTEDRYPPQSSVPGTGGNDGTPIGIGDCPRTDQYILIKSKTGGLSTKRAAFISDKDYLYNPREKKFQKVSSAKLIKNVPIRMISTTCGARCYSSGTHPLIKDFDDRTGIRAEEIKRYDSLIAVDPAGKETQTCAESNINTDAGDVVRIEMEAGHIYAAGSDPTRLLECHNAKQPTLNP